MIELVIAREGSEVNRYFLPQGVTTLGRADDNEIILDDVCVSRRHAQIRVEGERVLIEDLGSGNGTFCGETRIAKKELVDGDEIVIEPFHISLRKSAVNRGTSAPSRAPAKTKPPMELPEIDPPESLMEHTSNLRSEDHRPISGPHLEVIRGAGGRYALTGGEIRIGRSEEQDIVLKDASASRGHAILSIHNGRYTLRDNGSANGTFVNGRQIDEVSLRPGDVILIGNTEMRFVDPDSDRPTTSAMDDGATAGADGGMEIPMFGDGGAPVPQSNGGYEPTTAGGPPPMIDPMASLGGGMPPMTDPGGGMPAPLMDPMMDPMMGGGMGMEMDLDGGLYPQQAPPDSLIGRFAWSFRNNKQFRLFSVGAGVLLVGVLFIAVISGGGNKGQKGPPELKGIQREIMDRAKQGYKDAEQVMTEGDLGDAIARFEEVYQIAGKTELAGVQQANELREKALQQVLILHEVSVIATIEKKLNERFTENQADAAAVAKARSALERAHSTAVHRPSESNWSNVIAAADKLLGMVRSDAKAQEYKEEAASKRRDLMGKISQAQRDKLERDVKRLWDTAMSQKRRGDARSLNKAIDTLERVRRRDSGGMTSYAARAASEIRSIKQTLARAAAPRLATGKAEIDRRDWIRARTELQAALSIDPFNPQTAKLLGQVETECTNSARKAYQKALVFEEINNYSDAREQCRIALRYHPRKSDQFNIKCNELFRQLDRKQEGLR